MGRDSIFLIKANIVVLPLGFFLPWVFFPNIFSLPLFSPVGFSFRWYNNLAMQAAADREERCFFSPVVRFPTCARPLMQVTSTTFSIYWLGQKVKVKKVLSIQII